MVRKAFRFDDDISKTISQMATEGNTTETAIVTAAVRLYRDYQYMQGSASVIPTDITRVFASQIALLEHKLNNRSNQLLSEMAVQQCILCKVVADNLDINPEALESYRRMAQDFLETNQRVFRLEEGCK